MGARWSCPSGAIPAVSLFMFNLSLSFFLLSFSFLSVFYLFFLSLFSLLSLSLSVFLFLFLFVFLFLLLILFFFLVLFLFLLFFLSVFSLSFLSFLLLLLFFFSFPVSLSLSLCVSLSLSVFLSLSLSLSLSSLSLSLFVFFCCYFGVGFAFLRILAAKILTQVYRGSCAAASSRCATTPAGIIAWSGARVSAPAVKPPFPRELAKLLDGGGVLVAPFGFMRFLVCEGVWLIGCISWFRDLVFWSASL